MLLATMTLFFSVQDPAPAAPDVPAIKTDGRQVEVLDLGNGCRLQGRVLRTTEQTVLLDVGFDVLRVPLASVLTTLQGSAANAGVHINECVPGLAPSASSSRGCATITRVGLGHWRCTPLGLAISSLRQHMFSVRAPCGMSEVTKKVQADAYGLMKTGAVAPRCAFTTATIPLDVTSSAPSSSTRRWCSSSR